MTINNNKINQINHIVDNRMPNIPSYDIGIDICNFCIDYLNNDRLVMNENSSNSHSIGALFRSGNIGNVTGPVPSFVSDVRSLLKGIIASDKVSYIKVIREYEPTSQTIMGLIFYILRHLPLDNCLWYEIYDELVSTTDLLTQDFNQSKYRLSSILAKLDRNAFEFTRSFFKFFYRYLSANMKNSTVCGPNEISLVIAPLMCKPKNSAYLSIRHMVDLRKIRPIMSFILERVNEIFTKDFKPVYKPAPVVDSVEDITVVNQDPNSLARRRKSSLSINPHSAPLSPSLSPTNVLSKMKDQSYLYISPVANVEPSPLAIDSRLSQPLNFNGWEWKIVENIVNNRVETFLKACLTSSLRTNNRSPSTSSYDPLTNNDSSFFHSRSKSSKSSTQTSTYRSKALAGDISDEYEEDCSDDNISIVSNSIDSENTYKEMKVTAGVFSYRSTTTSLTLTEKDESPSLSPKSSDLNKFFRSTSNNSLSNNSSASNSLNSSANNSGTASPTKTHEPGLRRRMIAECKSLRAQIFQFEQDFNNKHGKDPKFNERGTMQSVYSAYRDMKRNIRDISAIDIQRVYRGHSIRIKNKSRKTNDNTSNNKLTRSNYFSSEVYKKYKEISIQKKEVKKLLKKFDEDFIAVHKRQPKKADKEVMRPMYENYNNIKSKYEELRKLIERQLGSVPDESTEDSSQFSNDSDRNIRKRSVDLDAEAKRSSSENSVITKKRQLLQLSEEKKNLHAYLKSYESDFNKSHGRPVMNEEDIKPVAHEYQRYKELKVMVKNLKESL